MVAASIKEASIVSFSPPAISGMSMMGGFEFQMLSRGEYTPQELEVWANKLIGAANQNSSLSSVYTSFQANVPQYILEIDYEKEMLRIQAEMQEVMKQEKKSQQMLEDAFRGIGYGID